MVRYIEEDNEEAPLTIKEILPTAYLTLLVGDRVSHSFPLRGEVQLGRDKSNAVVAADQKVSRHHATLTPLDNTYIINDQGSANGTYINGVLISQPTRLKENDRITFGDTTFLFTTTQPAANAIKHSSAPPAVIRDVAPSLDKTDMPIWAVIGCMAVIIIVLLFVVALLLGIFVGRSQSVGWALWWLASVVDLI